MSPDTKQHAKEIIEARAKLLQLIGDYRSDLPAREAQAIIRGAVDLVLYRMGYRWDES